MLDLKLANSINCCRNEIPQKFQLTEGSFPISRAESPSANIG